MSSSVNVRNSLEPVPEASQISTQRVPRRDESGSQTAPIGQSSVVPIAVSTLGYASALLSVSANASATACSTRRSIEGACGSVASGHVRILAKERVVR